MLRPWLKLFRVVNLPTVPGDVLVGAALAIWWVGRASVSALDMERIALAAVASCLLYMFGLADNDIVGAATDTGRPIADGQISMRAARIARMLCLALGVATSVSAACCVMDGVAYGVEYAVMFAVCQIAAALALVAAIVAYNRTKRPALMGLCRGLNVLLGVSSVLPSLLWLRLFLRAPLKSCAVAFVVAVWTVYIAAVTKYSEGEEADPDRRRRVGQLLGGIVYLQLAVLIVLAIVNPYVNPLLLAGAVLLVVLRVLKRTFPKVSAS